MSVLFLQLPDQKKFCSDVTIFTQTTLILQSAIQYWLKKMTDKDVFLLYISSCSLKKKLTHAYGLTLTFFYENHDGELRDISGNYTKFIFFKGVITGHHFWRYDAVLPDTDFTFWKFTTCSSLLAKQISHS